MVKDAFRGGEHFGGLAGDFLKGTLRDLVRLELGEHVSQTRGCHLVNHYFLKQSEQQGPCVKQQFAPEHNLEGILDADVAVLDGVGFDEILLVHFKQKLIERVFASYVERLHHVCLLELVVGSLYHLNYVVDLCGLQIRGIILLIERLTRL